MSWEDKVRENLYLQHSLRANNEADFQRRIQAADETVDFLKDIGNAIGDALTSKPAPPPPPPQSSGGNIDGKVLAGAAVAGGAFLLSKLFGGDDDKQVNKPKNNKVQSTKTTPG